MNYKRGDIVATDTGGYVMIIKEQISNDCAKIFAICDREKVYFSHHGWFDRLATKEEKARLFWLLSKKGYSWDEESCELIQEL